MENICSNNHPCTCPSEKCPRHGRCCECVIHHRDMGGVPQCFKLAGIEVVKKEEKVH